MTVPKVISKFKICGSSILLLFIFLFDFELLCIFLFLSDLQGFLKKQITFMSDFFNGSSFDDFSSQELVQSVFLSCFGSIIVKSYGKYLNVYLNDK